MCDYIIQEHGLPGCPSDPYGRWGVTVGPNAVLALKREGYRKTDLSLRDLKEMAAFRGFWRVIGDNLRSGITEYKNSFLITPRGYSTETGRTEISPRG